MRAKLITLTLVLSAVGAASLMMRHERLRLTSEATNEFRVCQAAARQLWRAEARAARLLRTEALQRRIDRARLALVPTPQRQSPAPGVRLVFLPDADSPLERGANARP